MSVMKKYAINETLSAPIFYKNWFSKIYFARVTTDYF